MMKIPGLILKQLYNFGSLENAPGGVRFTVKNRLSDATSPRLASSRSDGREVPAGNLTLEVDDGDKTRSLRADEVTAQQPVPFPLARTIAIQARNGSLEKGKHEIIGDVRGRDERDRDERQTHPDRREGEPGQHVGDVVPAQLEAQEQEHSGDRHRHPDEW